MMYSGGCIIVDHATGFVHIEHIINFTTIQAKQRLEKTMLDMGVLVQSYQSDNGIFTSTDFMDEVNKGLKNITFSGVGAHHQNGIAERGIQSILTKAKNTSHSCSHSLDRCHRQKFVAHGCGLCTSSS